MKTGRALATFGIAAMMGLGAVWVANNWLQARLGTVQTSGDGQASALAAAREIPFGKQIEQVDLRPLSLPKDAVPKGAVAVPADALGKVATQTIYAGELIMRERIVDHLGGSALAAVIAPDKRAITVRVNDVIGVAGFLLPGNRVDVLATRKEANRRVSSRTLLENIKVLAVDQHASPDKNEPTIVRAVTLELTPAQGENLVQATQEGSVQLALRNPTEPPKAMVQPVAPIVQPVAQRVSTSGNVTLIRGMDVTEIRVKQ
jgi:pilus assembly protein CpaB